MMVHRKQGTKRWPLAVQIRDELGVHRHHLSVFSVYYFTVMLDRVIFEANWPLYFREVYKQWRRGSKNCIPFIFTKFIQYNLKQGAYLLIFFHMNSNCHDFSVQGINYIVNFTNYVDCLNVMERFIFLWFFQRHSNWNIYEVNKY